MRKRLPSRSAAMNSCKPKGFDSGAESKRALLAPFPIELVDFFVALQIEPDQRRPNVADGLPGLLVSQEHPTAASRDARQPDLLPTPVQAEAKVIPVVRRGRSDV